MTGSSLDLSVGQPVGRNVLLVPSSYRTHSIVQDNSNDHFFAMFQGTLDTVWMSGLCNTWVDTMFHINFGMLVDTEHTRMCMLECILYHQHMGQPQIQKKLTNQQLLLVDPNKPRLNLICKTFAPKLTHNALHTQDVIPRHLLTHDPS